MLLGGVVPTVSALALSPDATHAFADRLGKGPGLSNHPVNVRPSATVTIPAGWPVARDGSITCSTCHEGLPSLSRGAGPQLRGPQGSAAGGQAFCMNCHTEGDQRTAAAMHWMAVPRAHAIAESESPGFGAPDAASRRCLGCHDGVTAAESPFEASWNGNGGHFGDATRSHPIGVPYARAGKRRSGVPLRAAALLPETIQLPNGLVSCISCHDLYGGTEKLLAVPIEGSRLCFACHDLN